jgi:hypothetical protein
LSPDFGCCVARGICSYQWSLQSGNCGGGGAGCCGSLDAIRRLEDLASPVTAFLRDRCDPPDPATDQRENVKALWDAWRHYCGEHGLRPGSDAVFGRNLHAVRPEVGTTGRGKRRCYTGVQLSEEGLEQYHEARRRAREGDDD